MNLAFVENDQIARYPIGRVDIARRFPDLLLPSDLNKLDLSAYGIVKVASTSPPAINPNNQKLETGVPRFVEGQWVETWRIVNLTADEVAQIEAIQAQEARSKRNHLLSESDWTQLADSPLDADGRMHWALYRETLRMIPQQSGFPLNINWPPIPGTN